MSGRMWLPQAEHEFLQQKKRELHERLKVLHPIRREMLQTLDYGVSGAERKAVKAGLNEVRADIREAKRQLRLIAEQYSDVRSNQRVVTHHRKKDRKRRKASVVAR